MTFLDICAGIGGFSLGLERAGMTCAGQVEIDDYCNRVLQKHWPHVSRWGDITALDPAALPAVDLICGGYPCQPFSLAGKRQGAGDDRHLWPYIRKIVAHVRPTWCLFENVAGHVSMGLDAVLSDLERQGYACGPLVIPACAVDAPHRRDRVWIVAYAESTGKRREERNICETYGRQGATLLFQSDGTGAHGGIGAVGNTTSARLSHGRGPQVDEQGEVTQFERSGGGHVPHAHREGCYSGPTNAGREARGIIGGDGARLDTNPHGAGSKKQHTAAVEFEAGQYSGLSTAEWHQWHQWPTEPRVGRVAHGIPHRVDRLKALGNAVVPQVVEAIGRAILVAHINKGCTP